VIPPKQDTVEAYRAAIYAYRRQVEAKRKPHGLSRADQLRAKRVAALAVLEVSPELTFEEAYALAHDATVWAAQTYWSCRHFCIAG
jgi:hypothetical protein